MPIPRLTRDGTALLVIDVQERLAPTIHQGDVLIANIALFAKIAGVLSLPTIVTEQYVKGLGPTVEDIAHALPPGTTVVEKTRFSAVVPEVRAILEAKRIRSVVVVGVEAHVCVLQSTLDLLAAGVQVFLATDAISSGQADQVVPAFLRMQAAGAAFTGCLGATYELLGDASDPLFRAALGHARHFKGIDHGWGGR